MSADAGTVERLRRSRSRIVARSNAARHDLERRLHNGAQQHLVAMAVQIRLIENVVAEDPAAAREMLAALRGHVQETVQHLRSIATLIYPPLLSERGLAEALRSAATRDGSALNARFDLSVERRYPEDIEAAVYFAVVEAVERAGDPVDVRVLEREGALVVEMDGVDDPALVEVVADHLETVGGELTRTPERIEARIPLQD